MACETAGSSATINSTSFSAANFLLLFLFFLESVQTTHEAIRRPSELTAVASQLKSEDRDVFGGTFSEDYEIYYTSSQDVEFHAKKKPDEENEAGKPRRNLTLGNFEVRVVIGRSARLPCTMPTFAQTPEEAEEESKALSWIRKGDYHILTSGMHTFTNDKRFTILHLYGSADWSLQIEEIRKEDEGVYECQVSHGNGSTVQRVHLKVIIPEATIIGGNEIHVDHGSTVTVVCTIGQTPEPPSIVLWYHNDRLVNFDKSRTRLTVTTEPGTPNGTGTHSRLVITNADYEDSGNYTCTAETAKPANVSIYVSGDKMAAIQKRNHSKGRSPDICLLCFLFLLVYATAPGLSWKRHPDLLLK